MALGVSHEFSCFAPPIYSKECAMKQFVKKAVIVGGYRAPALLNTARMVLSTHSASRYSEQCVT